MPTTTDSCTSTGRAPVKADEIDSTEHAVRPDDAHTLGPGASTDRVRVKAGREEARAREKPKREEALGAVEAPVLRPGPPLRFLGVLALGFWKGSGSLPERPPACAVGQGAAA